jgi:rod shape-determining protein MreC
LERGLARGLGTMMSRGYTLGKNIAYFFNGFQERNNLIAKNKEQEEKIILLEQELINLKLVLEQKGITDEQLKFLTERKLTGVAARVITRGTEANNNQFILNKGKRDGVKEGMVAVASGGLVIGKIFHVEETNAQLLLLTDSAVKLNAVNSASKNTTGLIRGYNNLGLRFEYLLKEREIKKGDLIISSGQEELIPAGLIIGEVDEVYEDERELFKNARIIQRVDTKNIDFVTIVLNY